MQKFVISLQGPQAIGKTTIARRLQKRLTEVHFDFEDPYPMVAERDRLGFDINTKTGFIANQRLFIQAECERFNKLPAGRIIMDRGPEDTECFTLTHPHVLNTNWDLETDLAAELQRLRTCHVSHILYLCLSTPELQRRKDNDKTRARGAFDIKSFSLMESWFRKRANTDFMNIDALTEGQVEERVLDWLEQKWNSQQVAPPKGPPLLRSVSP